MKYSTERNRVFPLMLLQTRATLLAKVASTPEQVVVLNDKNPDERILTSDELDIAHRLWG